MNERELQALLGRDVYRVIRPLGAGGMGAVWEVEDLGRGERVAMKVSPVGRGASLVRFKREFRTVAGLAHPNLVRLHDLGLRGNCLYYTMERIQGVDLATWVRWRPRGAANFASFTEYEQASTDEHPVAGDPTAAPEAASCRPPACDLDRLLAALPQVLDALEFLHAHGLVHRDLKPPNILVGAEGRVRLLDFGIAKDLGDVAITSDESGVVGTVRFMSPEQARARPVSAASDVYGLGCVLYELVAGRPVFLGTTYEMMSAHAGTPPLPLASLVPACPPRLARAIDAMLEKDPDRRPSIARLRELLGLRRLGPVPDPWGGASAHPILVGRETEKSAVEAHFAKPGPRVAVAWGEEGLGKTCFVEAMAGALETAGALVLRGRCAATESLPFAAFDQVIDRLALILGRLPREARARLAEELAIAIRAFPALGAATRGLALPAAGEAGDPRRARQRQATALGHLLRSAAQGRSVVLAIDDLHVCDRESAELLSDLLDNPLAENLRLLGALRWKGLSARHPIGALLLRRRETPAQLEFTLGPLGEDEIRRIAAARTGAPEDGELPARVAAFAQGSPFLAVELARLFADEGSGATAEALDPQALSRRRLARLTEAAGALVRLLALHEAPAALRVLRAASGLDDEAWQAALDELRLAGLIRRASDPACGDDATVRQEPRIELPHRPIRDAALAGTSPEVRAALHRAWALAGEAARTESAEALLLHWAAAGDAERARYWRERAAEAAERAEAFERAAEHLRALLAEAGPAEAAALGGRLAAALEAQGRPDQAAEALEEAARRAGTAALALRARRASLLMHTGRMDDGFRAFEDVLRPLGLSLFRGNLAGRILRLLLRLRLALRRVAPRPATPDARPSAGAAVHDALAACLLLEQPQIAEEHLLRRLLCEDSAGQEVVDALDEARRGVEALLAGPQGAEAMRRALVRAAAAKTDHVLLRRFVLCGPVLAAWATEGWRAALDLLAERIAGMGDGLGAPAEEATLLWALHLQTLLHLGDEAGIEAPLAAFLDPTPLCPATWALFASIELQRLLRTGRLDQADALLDRWRRVVPAEPWGRARAGLEQGELMRDVHRGRLDGLPTRGADLERRLRARGLRRWSLEGWAFRMDVLDGIAVLAAAGQVPAAARQRAIATAHHLARTLPPALQAAGHRASAVLEAAAGRDPGAAVGRALRASTPAEGPWLRWRCLCTAARLGRTNQAMEQEAAEIARVHGYRLALPV